MTNTTSKAEIESLAARLLAAEQATPKAAPGELHDHQILAITTAYEQGVGKGRQAHESGKEIANPYDTGYRCDLAWQYGYEEGKKQAQQEAQGPSNRDTVDVVGVRSNGEHVNLGKIAMPPRMKAREIAIEQFGSFKDDDGSDAEMCFGALEYFLEWLIRQGWSKAPPPAPAPLSDDAKDAARYRWLRATTNYVTSNGERIDVRNMPEKWDAAIDAAIAAQGGKA